MQALFPSLLPSIAISKLVKIQILTEARGHGLQILGLPLPGPALLPGRRDYGGGAVKVGHLGRRGRVGHRGRGGLQRHRADVRVLGVHRVMRVRRRVVMMMMGMMVEELGRGKGLAGVVRAGRVDRDRRALGRMQLGAHLVVQPAQHGAFPHAEVVALRQGHRARRAREAAHVEDELARAHHQLRGQDRGLAARAPLHAAEHPANRENGGWGSILSLRNRVAGGRNGKMQLADARREIDVH